MRKNVFKCICFCSQLSDYEKININFPGFGGEFFTVCLKLRDKGKNYNPCYLPYHIVYIYGLKLNGFNEKIYIFEKLQLKLNIYILPE